MLPTWQPLCTLVLASLAFDAHLVSGACITDGRHRNRACIVQDLNSSTGQNTSEPASFLYAAPMPPAIQAILLGQEHSTFDPQRSGEMLSMLQRGHPFQHFSHAHDTFIHHLRGTWAILNGWGQSDEICRAGLFHTAYGADLFVFSTLDPSAGESRGQLRGVLGEAGESLTWDFGTLGQSAVNATLFSKPDAAIPAEGLLLDSYLEGKERLVSARQLAKMSLVRIADNLDQMVEVNLWRDVHSFEVPSALYPGAMRPAVGLHWLSRLCKGIRPFLDVVPPIFDHCTAEISYEAEVSALRLYWEATAAEEAAEMSGASKVQRLLEASSLNPFVGEPHVYLAELHLQAGSYFECATEAKAALAVFYRVGTQWDKRLPFRQWVNVARTFLARCVRRYEGHTSFPISSNGVILTAELVREMERVSPSAAKASSSSVPVPAPESVV